MVTIKSPIRWAGGKSWIVPFVRDLIGDLEYNSYFEPFMGGASVFFSLETDKKCYLSDVNEELINAFTEIRDDVDQVIAYMKRYSTDSESYYRIRAMEPKRPAERAARFFYLNATSFNGLYRVNKEGKYNVPYGNRNIDFNFERLKVASEKLAVAELQCQDFDYIRSLLQKKDFVFLDPPYAVTNGESGFLGYNAKLFSLDDQYRLKDLVDYIDSIGAYYILTNASHPIIEEIFLSRGQMITLERNSLIGGKKAYRGKVKEFIFTNIQRGNM